MVIQTHLIRVDWEEWMRGTPAFFGNTYEELYDHVVYEHNHMHIKDWSESTGFMPEEEDKRYLMIMLDNNFEAKQAYARNRPIEQLKNGKWWKVPIGDSPDFSCSICRADKAVAKEPASPKELITLKQLAMWLAKGYGQCMQEGEYLTQSDFLYDCNDDDRPVPVNYRVRKWEDDLWHIPTVEYCFGKEE